MGIQGSSAKECVRQLSNVKHVDAELLHIANYLMKRGTK